jgi:cobalt-zinc-cadmium efflux system outer membrane protein
MAPLLAFATAAQAHAQAAPSTAPPAAPIAAPTSAATPAAAAPSVLTIDQAVREALDRNPSLAAERYNVTVADAAIKTARLRPNPVLTISALHPDGSLNSSTAAVQPNEQVVRTDYIFEGAGKRARRIDQAALAKGVTELQLQDTRRQLVLDVQQAFVDIQEAKLNLALAQENLGAFQDVVRINTERVRTGDLAPVELERSRLAALQFQNDLRQQETKLRVARSALATLLGRDPSTETLDVTGDLRKDDQPLDRDALQRLAHDQRPDLQAAKRDQARSEADIRLQLANGRIDYTISGEYHRQEQKVPDVKGNAYGVSLSVPLPFFNRNQGEIARARAEHDQLGARIAALDAAVSNDVTTAFAQYSAARESVSTIETQMLARARDVRTTTEYAYRRGEASFVEFLDAVRAFNDTMQSYNDARAEYARSQYALDAISGKVIP